MSTSFMGLVVKPGKKSKVTIPDGVKFSANQATLGDVASPGRSSLLVTRLDAETGGRQPRSLESAAAVVTASRVSTAPACLR